MDYGYSLSPDMSSAPASPSKQKGKWRFGKGPKPPAPSNLSSSSLDASKHSEAQSTASGQEAPPASPSKQKKAFKFSLPKKALEKKKEKKKEEEQALSLKGSSHHTRCEFDMIGGLPPWENPTLMNDELTAPSHAPMSRRAALNPTKPKKERNPETLTKGSIRSTSSSSKKQPGSNMTLEDLALNCDSSNSSISLEDIRCVNLDGSSDGTQSFSLVSNKSSLSGTGSRRSNKQHEQRCNMSLPSVQRTYSGCSASSSTTRRQPRQPRRTPTSGTNNPAVASSSKSPPTATEGTAVSQHVRQQSLTDTMNASMNLGDIFGDDELKTSIEGDAVGNDTENSDKDNYNNDDEHEDELTARENEMLRLAMERSVNDFGVRSTSNSSGASSRLYRAASSSSASSAPSVRQPPAMPKPRTFGNMNQSMDLGQISNEKSTGMGGGGGGRGGEEDLEEQERKMLEMALQRSVQDVGVHSNSMMRPSRPSSRRSGTCSGTRHASMNMSMDLVSVFEEEPSEPMSSHHQADDPRIIREQQKSPYGRDSTGNFRANPSYGNDHCGRQQALKGTSLPERPFDEGTDARLLAQQEEEMIRLAMERSMQDFTLPPQSPRRSSMQDFTLPSQSPRRSSMQDFTLPPQSPRRSSMQDFTLPPQSPRRSSTQDFILPPQSPRRPSDQNLHVRSASMGMIPNQHSRSHSADHDISPYSYSRLQRYPNDPSPQRAYSAGADDYGRRRDHVRGRRPRHPRPEPPSFRSNNFGELASVKEQEQEMFDQAIAMSRQEYGQASTSHYPS